MNDEESNDSNDNETSSDDDEEIISSEDTTNSSSSSSSSCSSSSSSEDENGNKLEDSHDVCPYFAHVAPDSEWAREVQEWTRIVPIGLGLCPWAVKSHGLGRLRYVTCEGTTPNDVVQLFIKEVSILLKGRRRRRQQAFNDNDMVIPPVWSSTLIVCPHVQEWKDDFELFQQFVQSQIYLKLTDDTSIFVKEQLTLVPFHPDFVRWRGLPDGLEVGSVVESHWNHMGRKSTQTSPATLLDTGNPVFGRRRVQVQFHHDNDNNNNNNTKGCRSIQYVPISWIVSTSEGPPLPDNVMHRAPHPTIHLITNTDLASMSIRDISRVKRRNAQRMMKLGWHGLMMKQRFNNCRHNKQT